MHNPLCFKSTIFLGKYAIQWPLIKDIQLFFIENFNNCNEKGLLYILLARMVPMWHFCFSISQNITFLPQLPHQHCTPGVCASMARRYGKIQDIKFVIFSQQRTTKSFFLCGIILLLPQI